MKFHLQKSLTDTSAVCGMVTARPDTFVYNELGFNTHLGKNYRCKKCLKIHETTKRLEYLRQELRAERISYAELAELQSLSRYIDKNDVELLEAAGVPEKH